MNEKICNPMDIKNIIKDTKLGVIIGNNKYYEGSFIVNVAFSKRHSKYNKIETKNSKFYVHYDPKEMIEVGTKVYIKHCKKISKTKSYKIVAICNRNEILPVIEEKKVC